jgi:hypothetical protein
MYFDERTNRSRTAFHEVDDDAQLMHDGPDRGHAATLAQDDSSSLDEQEDEEREEDQRANQ